MIANDVFVACFGIVPAGDTDTLPSIVRNAVRHGFAVVAVAPGQKKPICTLTARQAKAADREAKDAAQVAGRPNWQRQLHDCGIAHVLTDPAVADRVVKRLVKERGSINIGVEVGRSRMVMVDADTAEQVAGFLADWSAEAGVDMTGRRPTVTTPGKVNIGSDGVENWVHKDGGHFWFTVPDGIDLTALPGQGTLRADSGWVAVWRDHQALVPPSVRAEGAYAITGQVDPAPEWLLDRIQLAAHSWAERRAQQAERVHHDGDPIDTWAATTPWSDLLEPDGWTDTGLPDRCGCPIWTRPGNPAHYKSATAHELGCTKFDTEDSGHGPLHIWTDDPPEFLTDAVATHGRRTITKLQYLAWRDHEGHMGAAMSELSLDPISNDSLTADLHHMLDELEERTATGADPAPVAGETSEPAEVDPTGDPEPADEVRQIRAELDADPKLARAVQELHQRDRVRTVYERLRTHAAAADIRERMRAATDRVSDLPNDDEEDLWRIQSLWMQGQVALLSAKWKAGKTTIVLNVIRSLVDGKPFLDQFDATPIEGSLMVVNAEMTRRQFRKWLRESPIENKNKVFVFHVREAGPASGDILDPTRRELLIAQLNDCRAQVLILDPLNPLLSSSGVEENASSEVARWFNALADVIERSSVQDVLLVHHFGHTGERGRGSSKFMDAPDALWTYTVEDPPAMDDEDDDLLGQIETSRSPRYLSAVGRDVELVKSRVDFDDATRLLTMPVIGGVAKSRATERAKSKASRARKLREQIVDAVKKSPGIGRNGVYTQIGGNRASVLAAVTEAVEAGDLSEETDSKGSKLTAAEPR